MTENTLKEKTAKGLMWGTISNGAQLVLGTLFGIFLARILSPSDYGMVGLLTVFSQIASVLQDSGFRTALANRREIVHEDYNAVFWFNVGTSCVMYLLLFFLAPLITEFYQHSDAAANQDLSELTPLARFQFRYCALRIPIPYIASQAESDYHCDQPHYVQHHRPHYGLEGLRILGLGHPRYSFHNLQHHPFLVFLKMASHFTGIFPSVKRNVRFQQ